MKYVFSFLLVSSVFCSCDDSHESVSDERKYDYSDEFNSSDGSDEKDFYGDTYDDYAEKRFEDGTYSATVDYYNPETGYSETYTLDVEVEDNQLTIIYFPNGGYIDSDHIWPEELDEYGFVSIQGEEGKAYDVQIDF